MSANVARKNNSICEIANWSMLSKLSYLEVSIWGEILPYFYILLIKIQTTSNLLGNGSFFLNTEFYGVLVIIYLWNDKWSTLASR